VIVALMLTQQFVSYIMATS